MVRTAIVPLVVSTLVYLVLSRLNPVQIANNALIPEIKKVFEINLIVFLPALVVLILSLFRVEVKLTMLISVIAALAIGKGVQGYSFFQLFKFMMLGYSLEGTTYLKNILSGGGVVSMAKVSLVVIVSTALAAIFAETKRSLRLKVFLNKAKSRVNYFWNNNYCIASAAFGCTQTIAILLTQQLVQDKYERSQLDNYQLAVDLENTAVVLSALIPWNIAGLVPATLLMTTQALSPYAFYLYLLPVFSFIQFKLSESKKLRL
jgi:NhaC family Na+:H+ antiporter